MSNSIRAIQRRWWMPRTRADLIGCLLGFAGGVFLPFLLVWPPMPAGAPFGESDFLLGSAWFFPFLAVFAAIGTFVVARQAVPQRRHPRPFRHLGWWEPRYVRFQAWQFRAFIWFTLLFTFGGSLAMLLGLLGVYSVDYGLLLLDSIVGLGAGVGGILGLRMTK